MNKGFVIMAQNTEKTDYVYCANILKKSLLKSMPGCNVTIITELPDGDICKDSDWKLANDYQVYKASPYDYTIKLEADMIIPYSIDYYWEVLKDKDIVISSHIRNYKNEISNVKFYRKFIYENNLPDVYNGITYFKKSDKAKLFFDIVKDVFINWEQYKNILKCNLNEECTTDWAYSIACHIIGIEETTINFQSMSMVHMKQFINDLYTEDWTKELIYENTDIIKINTFPQVYPFHYHIKNFAKKMGKKYE